MARNHVNSLPLVQVHWYDFICEKRGPNASAEKHVNENVVRYGSSRRLTKAALVACIEAGSAAAAALPWHSAIGIAFPEPKFALMMAIIPAGPGIESERSMVANVSVGSRSEFG